MNRPGRRAAFGTREWEDEVYAHVSTHCELEGELLREYQRLANDDSASPAFRYVARMIPEDEVRHHRIFEELATTMRKSREHDDADPPVPSLRGFYSNRVRIKRATDELLEAERADLRELKGLSKQLKELRKVSLWGLLIDIMVDDTKKHIKLLEFIRDRAEDQPD